MNERLTLLGGLTAKEFLRDYWQKKPLLIRQAIPQFTGLINPQQLLDLAREDDIQARMVQQIRGKFKLLHAPFTDEDLIAPDKAKWTVLVQGVNHYLPAASSLLGLFNFIPHARLDDLMVSYAPKGGGVGPHFDSYDVFLLQGCGHRRWQISTQSDRTLIEGAPLRILKDFTVEQEWILAPGDMLYLPPQCAHNGIAEDDCMTYSIGFRTPAYQELAEQFLVYLQDRIEIEGMYADPDLKIQQHPSLISDSMLKQAERAIKQVQWDKEDIANFLGCYLSEPKPNIFFDTPEPALNRTQFLQEATRNGLSLDLKSLMLCRGAWVYLNGEASQPPQQDYSAFLSLADDRKMHKLPQISAESKNVLFQWYLNGYILPKHAGE